MTEFGIRTAAVGDLGELRRVYREASLSNSGDAPLLLSRPEFLVFGGEGIAGGCTRIAVGADDVTCLGFATVVGDELEDLFVDPVLHRRGIARALILDAVGRLRGEGRGRLWVTGNPHALAFYTAVGFVGEEAIATQLGSGLRLQLDVTGGG